MTGTLKQMNIQQQGAENFPGVAGWVDNLVLAAGTAQTYSLTAVRAAAGEADLFLVFGADGNFWANFNGGTAAAPGANKVDGTGSELNPNQRYIDSTVTSISFYSTAGCNLSIQVSKI